ncbi:hypothetical protein BKA70DRAFT_1563599 [Coprinopsis sp. MPI-PUGE-AT-0042]|nr:hypothetical protein BKA70DRAFT_1563599 [Coprinopsis sp. MPI-PUGE-AT-0042]
MSIEFDERSFVQLGRGEGDVDPAILTRLLSLIEKKKADILALRDEIKAAEVNGPAPQLESKYWALRDEVEGLRSLCPPVRRLPTEVLADIFLLAHGEDYIHFPSWSSCLGRSWSLPWSLAAVCFYWRTVAINLPQLWSSVSFTNGCFCSNEGRDYPGLRLILDRSRSQPFRLSFPNPNTTWCRRGRGPCQWEHLALPYMKDRVRVLTAFRLPLSIFDATLLHFPCLEALVLHGHEPSEAITPLSAPRLSSLSLFYPSFGSDGFLNLRIDYLSLKQLSIACPNPMGFDALQAMYRKLVLALAQMPNLERLCIEVHALLGSDQAEGLHSQQLLYTRAVHLPHLHTLELRDPRGFLDRVMAPGEIDAPALKVFTYFTTMRRWKPGVGLSPIWISPIRRLVQSAKDLQSINVNASYTRDRRPLWCSLIEIPCAAMKGAASHDDPLREMLLTRGCVMDRRMVQRKSLLEEGRIERHVKIHVEAGESENQSPLARTDLERINTTELKPLLDSLANISGGWTLFIETRIRGV